MWVTRRVSYKKHPSSPPVFGGFRVAHLYSCLCCPITCMCLYVVSLVLLYPLRFPHKSDVRFVFTSSWLYWGSCLIYVIYVFVCALWLVFALFVFVLCLDASLSGLSFCIALSRFANIYSYIVRRVLCDFKTKIEKGLH